MVELVSRANKDGGDSAGTVVRKVGGFRRAGVHVVILDLLPPTRSTPGGWHAAVIDEFLCPPREDEEQPVGRDVPLFLTAENYVNLPLGTSYAAAFRGLPFVDRDLLTAPPCPDPAG